MKWIASKCKAGYLHRFDLLKEDKDCAIEICQICRTRRFYRVRNGRVNNYKYASEHIRSMLQPAHRLFNREYNK